MNLHLYANVGCSLDINISTGSHHSLEEIKSLISEELMKVVKTIPYANGPTTITNDHGENVKITEGLVWMKNEHYGDHDLYTKGDTIDLQDDELMIFVQPEPVYLILGEEACNVMMEEGIDYLCQQIEDDEITDYELYQFTGDLPDLLSRAVYEHKAYAFLSKDDYNKLNDL